MNQKRSEKKNNFFGERIRCMELTNQKYKIDNLNKFIPFSQASSYKGFIKKQIARKERKKGQPLVNKYVV